MIRSATGNMRSPNTKVESAGQRRNAMLIDVVRHDSTAVA